VGKNLKIYNLEFHFVLLGVDFVNCGYNFGVLGDPESSNESIRKKRGERENILFCISGDEEQPEQELKRQSGGIYIIYIKVQIDRTATMVLFT